MSHSKSKSKRSGEDSGTPNSNYFTVKVAFQDIEIEDSVLQAQKYSVQIYINGAENEILYLNGNQEATTTLFLNETEQIIFQLQSTDENFPIIGSCELEAGLILKKQKSEFSHWFQLNGTPEFEELDIKVPRIMMEFSVNCIFAGSSVQSGKVLSQKNSQSFSIQNPGYQSSANKNENKYNLFLDKPLLESTESLLIHNADDTPKSQPKQKNIDYKSKAQVRQKVVSTHTSKSIPRKNSALYLQTVQKSHRAHERQLRSLTHNHDDNEETNQQMKQIEEELVLLNKFMARIKISNEQNSFLLNQIKFDLIEVTQKFEGLKNHNCQFCLNQYAPGIMGDIDIIREQFQSFQESKHIKNTFAVENQRLVQVSCGCVNSSSCGCSCASVFSRCHTERNQTEYAYESPQKGVRSFNVQSPLRTRITSHIDYSKMSPQLSKIAKNFRSLCQQEKEESVMACKKIAFLKNENHLKDLEIASLQEKLEFHQKKDRDIEVDMKKMKLNNFVFDSDIKNLKQKIESGNWTFSQKASFKIELLRDIYQFILDLQTEKNELKQRVLICQQNHSQKPIMRTAVSKQIRSNIVQQKLSRLDEGVQSIINNIRNEYENDSQEEGEIIEQEDYTKYRQTDTEVQHMHEIEREQIHEVDLTETEKRKKALAAFLTQKSEKIKL